MKITALCAEKSHRALLIVTYIPPLLPPPPHTHALNMDSLHLFLATAIASPNIPCPSSPLVLDSLLVYGPQKCISSASWKIINWKRIMWRMMFCWKGTQSIFRQHKKGTRCSLKKHRGQWSYDADALIGPLKFHEKIEHHFEQSSLTRKIYCFVDIYISSSE